MHKNCNVKIAARLIYKVVPQRYKYFQSLIDSRLQRENILFQSYIYIYMFYLNNFI